MLFNKILLNITCLKFFSYLKSNEHLKAYEVFENFNSYLYTNNPKLMEIEDHDHITIDLYDKDNNIRSFSLFSISSLLGFENVLDNEFSFMLNENQNELIANQINSGILELVGLNKESILEICFKQLELTKNYLNKIKNCSGEKIKIKS